MLSYPVLAERVRYASCAAFICFLLAFVLMGAACGGPSRASGTSAVPTITSFTATPPTIEKGTNTVLSWAVAGATSMSINSAGGKITNGNALGLSSTSLQVTPLATTDYTLTATNSMGTTNSTITVTLVDPPQISTFTASPSVITLGQSTTLAWTVSGITSLSIDQGVGDVTGSSSITIRPVTTTTYNLTGLNLAGHKVTASVQIKVVRPPSILSFKATPALISTGKSSVLSWTVTGANGLSIDNGVGSVNSTSDASQNATGSITVSPGASTTYTLSATETDSGLSTSATAEATVSVTTSFTPVITSFTATPPSSGPGTNVTLSAEFDGGSKGTATITDGGTTYGPFSSSPVSGTVGSYSTSTVFTLTVSNDPASLTPLSAISKRRVAVGNLSILAGTPGVGAYSDGTGSSAHFHTPQGVDVDNAGNIYVADSLNNIIRKITPAGVVTTIAGNPDPAIDCTLSATSCYADGVGLAALFYNPNGVAVDRTTGNVYVADSSNNVIRKIALDGTVTTLAGTAGLVGSSDTPALFNGPQSLVVDGAGNVLVCDTLNDLIRKVAPDGTVTTVAGQALKVGGADGAADVATFNQPLGIAIDNTAGNPWSGNIYVADTQNKTIRVISEGQVSTVAGLMGTSGHTDGPGTSARFSAPTSVAVDAYGYIYVTDQSNYTIRRITPDGVVDTIIGNPTLPPSTTPTGPLPGRITTPNGIVADPASGSLYISLNNQIIIKAPY